MPLVQWLIIILSCIDLGLSKGSQSINYIWGSLNSPLKFGNLIVYDEFEVRFGVNTEITAGVFR